MLKLHDLAPLVKKRKRVGRGGSRGGTSGKGHKGQKARSGGSIAPGFEGGQMPLHRRLPKRGFTNSRFKKEFQTVNLEQLERSFDDGAQVTREILIQKGLIKGFKGKKNYFVKILGNGELNKKLTVSANSFSKSARAVIEKNGGQIRLN